MGYEVSRWGKPDVSIEEFVDQNSDKNNISFVEENCPDCGEKFNRFIVLTSKDFERYKTDATLRSGFVCKKGDPKLKDGHPFHKQLKFEISSEHGWTGYCDICAKQRQEEADEQNAKREADRIRKIDELLNKSFFSRFGGEPILRRVSSVKQHRHGFIVITDDGVTHQFPIGEYSYKVATKREIDTIRGFTF